MKKTLFLAMMTLAALTATAQEDPDDYTGYIIVPIGTPAGTVVWNFAFNQDFMNVLNQMVPPIDYELYDDYGSGGQDYFQVSPDRRVIYVSRDLTLVDDNLTSGKKFTFIVRASGKNSNREDVFTGAVVKLAIGKVSMAEGTPDPDKWSLGANASVVPPGIKATYSGKRKIKSVTARKVTTQ